METETKTEEWGWAASNERAGVERFLADAAARRVQLLTEFGAAQERAERAREELARRQSAHRAQLCAMVADAHRALARLEAEHGAAVESARAPGRGEVTRLPSRTGECDPEPGGATT